MALRCSRLITFAFLASTLWGKNCPHEGSDKRLFRSLVCPLQRGLTIENARPPGKIFSIRAGNLWVKVDPRHPHLLVESRISDRKWLRFRAGYRWDLNARAYIFPAVAFKMTTGPMREYQKTARSDTVP